MNFQTVIKQVTITGIALSIGLCVTGVKAGQQVGYALPDWMATLVDNSPQSRIQIVNFGFGNTVQVTKIPSNIFDQLTNNTFALGAVVTESNGNKYILRRINANGPAPQQNIVMNHPALLPNNNQRIPNLEDEEENVNDRHFGPYMGDEEEAIEEEEDQVDDAEEERNPSDNEEEDTNGDPRIEEEEEE